MWVKGELIKDERIFNNLVDISSYPDEFFVLRDFIFSTSLEDKNFSLMSGKGVLKDCSR
jgi:hypothetical protein